MSEGYFVRKIDGKEVYLRTDSLSQLKRVDAVIFDCDGVLVDVRDSYNKAISKASAYIFESLTGYAFSERLISDEVIFLFRRSGGFNNDWDTVYGILMFMLCSLPEKDQAKLEKRIEGVGKQSDPFERLSAISELARRQNGSEKLSREFFETTIQELKKFTELLDSTGALSVDRNLAALACSSAGFCGMLKDFLCYSGGVGENIIATVFEELFCGAELFEETYGLKPRFHEGLGMIENERILVRHETLDRLTSILDKANLGIASGSRFKPARHALGDLLDRFKPEASVFLENMERAERDRAASGGARVDLKKPNPFSLLKAAEALKPFDCALYVGDSMEDVMMVREAGKADPCFLFAGVYCHSSCADAVLRDFLKYDADIIVPSVEELPLVLQELRREKTCG